MARKRQCAHRKNGGECTSEGHNAASLLPEHQRDPYYEKGWCNMTACGQRCCKFFLEREAKCPPK